MLIEELKSSEASLGPLAHYKGQIKAVFSPKVGNQNIGDTSVNDSVLFPAMFVSLGVTGVNMDSWTKGGCGRTLEEISHVDLILIWKKVELIVWEGGLRYKKTECQEVVS